MGMVAKRSSSARTWHCISSSRVAGRLACCPDSRLVDNRNMRVNANHTLTALLFLPLAGALLLVPFWQRSAVVRGIALVTGVAELVLASARWFTAAAPQPTGVTELKVSQN